LKEMADSETVLEKKKFPNLTAKDNARRQLEEKGKKWDSADWVLGEGTPKPEEGSKPVENTNEEDK